MYSFPNLEPVRCSTSDPNCCFFTCIQVSLEAGQVVWYSHFLKNLPQFVIHTVKGFSIINKAEIDVFLEISCFFCDPADGCNLIFGSSAFSKSSLNIWKFSICKLLKPSLENFEHYFASVGNVCPIVQWFEYTLALPFLRLEWKLTFSSSVATAEFSEFAGILSAAL